MFLDTMMSTVGRSTEGNLSSLRHQLGVGVDPAFDYSEMEAQLKQHRLQKGKKKAMQKKEKLPAAEAGTGVDQLWRALRDVVGASPTEDDQNPKEADDPTSPEGAARSMSPNKRKQERPSNWASSTSREHLQRLEEMQAQSPECIYRPKYELLGPRVLVKDFGEKEKTKSRHEIRIEKEILKRQAEGQPFDDLIYDATSVELMEHIPERMREKPKIPDFVKQSARPDMKGREFNFNTFDAGVLDGSAYSNSSESHRQPEWDFDKTSVAQEKMRETYFQPGQYNPKLDTVRPKREVKNIPWEQNSDRVVAGKGARNVKSLIGAGFHLPDRSLARSCPALSTQPRMLSPDFDKYSDRPVEGVKKPYHNSSDPKVDRHVENYEKTFDIMETTKALWTRPRTVDHHNKGFTRAQQIKCLRSYGQDINLQLARDNVTRGPRSIELKEDPDSTYNQPSLTPTVTGRKFFRMAGREHEKKYLKSPARQKDQGNAAKFERGDRVGESKNAPQVLSPMAGAISTLRSTRTFDPLSATY
eukprot:TRINITY_DN93622_c0_g1_i1.p1 TRINITY_DN93622_c0_g1~~TRINITY_DN93622_c0_g1_i1.p1  ORF type:complete len:529 (-),score=79.96 TRINITY_DN93622_c0_g1_i1:42-1628(-)